jgi:hypothetical protein
MVTIQKEDKAWLSSNTKQYFIAKNFLWSTGATFSLIIVLSLLSKIFGFSFEWVFLGTLPSGLVFITSFFIGYNKKWQLKFLKEAKDQKQKQKSLQNQIEEIQKEKERALKLYVLLVDFNK